MAMARKMVVLLPAISAAFIIGILGLLLIPSEVKNRDLSFPTGAIKIVVYIKENALFCTNPFDASKCTYKNTSAAKYVVAASSGFVANHNISLNSAMDIVSI
jgi:hypothetical protein